jgi:hypothetical protein
VPFGEGGETIATSERGDIELGPLFGTLPVTVLTSA